MIPGPDTQNCSYYTYRDQHGKELLHLTKRCVRRYPINQGKGTYQITEHLDDVQAMGRRFFDAIDYRGIGNLEFGFLYGEDEHNVYLRALLSYGWLGFVSWLALVFWPLVAGFKILFQARPWQVYFQIAYVVVVGHLMVGWVIDIDHWRHFYLLLGILWGCILLEQKRTRALRSGTLPTARA